MLAAGNGSRLLPFTEHCPKCLVEVNNKPLLAHTIDALETSGFERLIIITGYCHDAIHRFLNNHQTGLEITTVYNDRFSKTNNIYSLWLAEPWVNEPFMLIESDLVYEPGAIAGLRHPDRIALDRYNPSIHSGTTATVTDDGFLEKLYINEPAPVDSTACKTVNIYSFSLDSWIEICSALNSHLNAGQLDGFYELAIQELVESGGIRLKAIDFSNFFWDEIDTVEDLERVKWRYSKQPELVHNAT